jgi:hypothetical protein
MYVKPLSLLIFYGLVYGSAYTPPSKSGPPPPMRDGCRLPSPILCGLRYRLVRSGFNITIKAKFLSKGGNTLKMGHRFSPIPAEWVTDFWRAFAVIIRHRFLDLPIGHRFSTIKPMKNHKINIAKLLNTVEGCEYIQAVLFEALKASYTIKRKASK